MDILQKFLKKSTMLVVLLSFGYTCSSKSSRVPNIRSEIGDNTSNERSNSKSATKNIPLMSKLKAKFDGLSECKESQGQDNTIVENVDKKPKWTDRLKIHHKTKQHSEGSEDKKHRHKIHGHHSHHDNKTTNAASEENNNGKSRGIHLHRDSKTTNAESELNDKGKISVGNRLRSNSTVVGNGDDLNHTNKFHINRPHMRKTSVDTRNAVNNNQA